MQTRFLRSLSSFLTALLLLGALPLALQAAAAFPYPQNRTYPFGSKPAPFGANAAADAATILGKYNTWKSSHVVSAGAGMLRVQRDAADGNDTVSEGISYGMILAVYFNDQTTYDQLWAYKQSKNDGFGLMNWQISSGGGVIGANSAADADQDIAYSLYLANQQWGSGGTLNYKSLADAEMLKIIAYDLDTNRIKPGDSFNSCRYPSYFFPNEYRIYAKEKPADASTWSAVRTNCYNTQVAASNNTTGLVPEQCSDTGGPAGCTPSNPNSYYYNSARVPLRLAIDYCYYGDPTAASELSLLNGFFGPINPGSVMDCYNLNGSTCGSYNSGAFVGPAGAGLMRTGGANLQTYYNALMADGSWPGRYFDGALAIWSLLLMSGNLPNIGDPSTIFTPTPTFTVTPYAGTPTFTATTTPIAFAYIFEDFENAILVNSYNYTGPAAGPTVASGISSAQKFGGSYSDLVQVSLPTAGNYGGHGFDSSYAPASGVLDFTGASAVRFYVRSDKAVSIRVSFREGNGINGGDDEVYDSIFTAIPGTNTWTAVTIPINATNFKENPYNPSCTATGCTGTAGTGTNGNNVFNLSSIKTAEFSFNPIIAAPAANVYIDDIAFIPAVVPTMTPTKTPFANPFTLIYDDFENASSLATGAPLKITTYANTALSASAAWSLETVAPLVGLKSGRLDYNLGTAGTSYGAGGSFVSPYYTGTFTSPNAMAGRTVDATGAVSLSMWIKAAAGLKFRLTFQEAGTLAAPVGASDGESWYTALLTGTGAWQKLTVDISEFVEDPYNTLCNPTSISAPGPCITGASKGNNTPNLNAIWQVGIKLPGEQVGVASRTGTVFFDDVAFITSYRTFTPSPSATPGLASPTSTRTPSPSPSPSATPTATPSASPTASPTRTATASVTPSNSPSPTPSRTATPLANTPTFTPSSSATGTVSASPSSTGSRTATLSSTPSFSSTASPSASSTATPSRTATLTVTLTPSPTQTSTRTSTVVLPTSTMTGTPPPGSTATFTSTISPTSSVTPSISPTPTATSSATRSATPSSTGTPTQSATLSASPSQTPVNTATPTSSATRSITPSVTLTPSPSQSPSSTLTVVLPSATSTDTPLPGSTFTSTSTVSPLPTATPSVTLTASPSASPTSSVTAVLPSATSTGTPLPGSTHTSTQTPSPVVTLTSTQSPLPSATASSTSVAAPPATFTRTVTPSVTAVPGTATPTRTATASFTTVLTSTHTPVQPASTWTPDNSGKGPILCTLPVPNPGPHSVAVELNKPVDRLTLKIYAKSMVCISSVSSGGAGAGWVTLPLPTEFLMSAASGTYYYVVTAERNGSQSRALGTGKMLIIR